MRLALTLLALSVYATTAFGVELRPANAEIESLKERVRKLEEDKARTDTGLADDRLTEDEPELVTRLKDAEFRTLAMQKQARTIEALQGITTGIGFTNVGQSANNGAEGQWNYRADVSIGLPGGEIGNTEGKLFAHFRMGQGDGLTRLLPTYSGVNATGFRVQGARPDDSATVLLAQAWYQLDIPLPVGGFKPRSRETLTFNFGKMDPFLFFDQNVASDDETVKLLNTAFVHNPLLDAGGDVGVDAFGFTPGLRLAYRNETRKPITWEASFAMFGAGSGATYTDTFEKPFYIAQIETGQRFFSGLAGNYRLYAWRNGQSTPYANPLDASTEIHSGFGVSVDQRVGNAMMLFGRYGRETRGRVRFDRALTIGAEFGGSYWDRAADAIGVALGTLRTSADFARDSATLDAGDPLLGPGTPDGIPDFGYAAHGAETLAEVYYRLRVIKQLELSLDVQHIRQPAGDDAADNMTTVALRTQFTF